MTKLKALFVKEFRRCLIKRYGKVPSSARIARDFTLSSPDGMEPISVETVRKWLLGTNLPQSGRMRTLCNWLGFDATALDGAFKLQSNGGSINNLDTEKSIDSEMVHLLHSFSELHESERQTVLEIVNLYRRSKTIKK